MCAGLCPLPTRSAPLAVVNEKNELLITDNPGRDVTDLESLLRLETDDLRSLESLVFTARLPDGMSAQIIMRIAKIIRYTSGRGKLIGNDGETITVNIGLHATQQEGGSSPSPSSSSPSSSPSSSSSSPSSSASSSTASSKTASFTDPWTCPKGCPVVTHAVEARRLLSHRSLGHGGGGDGDGEGMTADGRRLWGSVGKWIKVTSLCWRQCYVCRQVD